jgi:hypothetical protein
VLLVVRLLVHEVPKGLPHRLPRRDAARRDRVQGRDFAAELEGRARVEARSCREARQVLGLDIIRI